MEAYLLAPEGEDRILAGAKETVLGTIALTRLQSREAFGFWGGSQVQAGF